MKKDFSFKYRIKEKLEELNHKDYKAAVTGLPLALKISSATFGKYLSIRIYADYSIPSDHLLKLATFFGCRMEDLLNYTSPELKVKGLRRPREIDIKRKFHLVK